MENSRSFLERSVLLRCNFIANSCNDFTNAVTQGFTPSIQMMHALNVLNNVRHFFKICSWPYAFITEYGDADKCDPSILERIQRELSEAADIYTHAYYGRFPKDELLTMASEVARTADLFSFYFIECMGYGSE